MLSNQFLMIEDRERVLRAIFGVDWRTYAFLVNEPDWGVRKKLEDLDDERGCYWCVGAIPWGKDRLNFNVENVRALVVDDVGTKVSMEDVRAAGFGEATLAVQTSKSNFQMVWRFERPLTVVEFAKLRARISELIPGASDGKDPAHLFRLPWGVNRKPGRGAYKVNGSQTDVH